MAAPVSFRESQIFSLAPRDGHRLPIFAVMHNAALAQRMVGCEHRLKDEAHEAAGVHYASLRLRFSAACSEMAARLAGATVISRGRADLLRLDMVSRMT
jgi:hypothetical protein